MNTELIDTDRISVKFNFRTSFDEAKIKELSQSILKCGVLQPIILRKAGKELILVAGERRVRAAKLAGLKQIPCRILDLTEEQGLEAACMENLHREDLNPMEEARKEAKAEGYVFEKDKYGYGMKFFFNEYPVLTEEERKKLAREIKKNPSEFGIGADKAFSVIRMFAVGKAAQEKLKELRESAQAAEEAPQEEDEDWQKENFIREETERLILKGLPKLKCEIPKDFDDAFSLFDGLSHNQEKWLLKKFGVKSFRAEDLKALPPEKILMIFYLDKKILWQDFADVICDLAGLDAKKLREDCEAQAKQAWDNRE